MENLSSTYLDQCRSQLLAEQTTSLAETNNWAHVDRPRVHADWDVLYKELAPLIDRSAPGDAAIQALTARHFDIVGRFFTPSKDAYIGMSLFYAENEDMRKFHEGYHPRMVAFLGAAMCAYAHAKL
ncbi:TipAS antibiotic-recognition domain-containing protein [Janthinobacterium sp.]|uniref:TipAS antibiotic-recognition domain-containing protein n=1 Tax=Janthinobacterium sp. TaxID=1871054 RepID=UPI00293D1D58|nr:TipAS antibiotic-recognition domain-containing protein [Janthinobacterium sp.]